MNKVRAMIEWIDRKPVPQGCSRYSPICKLVSAAHPEVDGWSLVINDFNDNSTEANVTFLVDAAPHEMLVPGFRFPFFEGKHVAGYVTIKEMDRKPHFMKLWEAKKLKPAPRSATDVDSQHQPNAAPSQPPATESDVPDDLAARNKPQSSRFP